MSSKTPPRQSEAEFHREATQLVAIINKRSLDKQGRKAKILAFHDLGRLLRQRFPERPRYGDSTFGNLAESVGREVTWMYRVRRFAERYSRRDMKRLCNHADKINWTHIVHLMRIEDSIKRRQYEDLTIEHSWTPSQLRHQLIASEPRKASRGRALVTPPDLMTGLLRICDDAETWIRRCDQLMEQFENEVAKKRKPKQLRETEERMRSILDKTSPDISPCVGGYISSAILIGFFRE